ncbi:MAG: hypothetical protein QOF25_3264 [Mycobacterium sp.]|nr:hypothetical protein [Mycobacterium sp.]
MLAELIGAFVSLVWLPGYSTSATTDVVGGWPASEPSAERVYSLLMANSTAEFTPPPATYAS